MSIDEQASSKIFALMTEEEIKEISHVMSSLGPVKGDMVDNLMGEFATELSSGSNNRVRGGIAS